MRVFEDYVGSSIRDRRIVAELLQHELSNLSRISNRDMNQKVFRSASEQDLNYLRVLAHGLHESSEVGPGTRPQGHGDNRL